MTVTGCRRSNWANWNGEERYCEGEEALVDSGRKAWGLAGLPLPCLASAWPGLPDGKTAAQGEIFLRWCKESVARFCGEWRSNRFDSDQQGRRVSGLGWASDGAATRLAGGFTVTVRCGAMADGGGGEGAKQGARRAAAAAAAAGETAWGRRLVAVAGLWVLGSGCAVRCGAVQRSAAQETRRLGRWRVQKLS